MFHRRQMVTAALFALVLGACTTLALPWALAEWRPLPDELPMAGGLFMHWNDPWPWSTVERHAFGVSVINWSRAMGDYVTLPPDGSIKSRLEHFMRVNSMTPQQVMSELQEELDRLVRDRPGYVLLTHPPRWGTFAAGEAPPDGQRSGADTAFGWPMRCMWYQVQGQYGKNLAWGDQLHGGIARRGQPSAVIRQHRVLPLMPIWPGLFGNTAFYAVLWFALLLAPGAVRRAMRRRRGWCVECGYNLSGNISGGCPECGLGRVTSQ